MLLIEGFKVNSFQLLYVSREKKNWSKIAWLLYWLEIKSHCTGLKIKSYQKEPDGIGLEDCLSFQNWDAVSNNLEIRRKHF